MSGYAGGFPWFGKYDPYYNMRGEKCVRPYVQSADCKCTCVRNVDTCKKVLSATTFTKKEMKMLKHQAKCKKCCHKHYG